MKKKIIIFSIIILIICVGAIVFFVPKSISNKKTIDMIVTNYQREGFETINNFPDLSLTYEYEKKTFDNQVQTSLDKGTWYVTKKGKDQSLYLEIETKWEVGTVGNNKIKYYIKDGNYLYVENDIEYTKNEEIWQNEVMIYFISLFSPSHNNLCLLDANLLQTNLVSSHQQGFKISLEADYHNEYEDYDILINASYLIGHKYFHTYQNQYTTYDKDNITSVTLRKYTFKY